MSFTDSNNTHNEIASFKDVGPYRHGLYGKPQIFEWSENVLAQIKRIKNPRKPFKAVIFPLEGWIIPISCCCSSWRKSYAELLQKTVGKDSYAFRLVVEEYSVNAGVGYRKYITEGPLETIINYLSNNENTQELLEAFLRLERLVNERDINFTDPYDLDDQICYYTDNDSISFGYWEEIVGDEDLIF